MSALPVEWVLVIYYGPSAHRATYGRFNNSKDKTYTKDYIQLSRKSTFMDAIDRYFPKANSDGSAPLTYKWPTGTASGALVLISADRPHLKWETSVGAPLVWRMSIDPTEETAQTIPGDPTHTEIAAAEREFELLASRGAGQPYLFAIKLVGEDDTLQLRAYLSEPSEDFEWASISLVPQEIQDIAAKTSQRSALAWSSVASGGVAPSKVIDAALSRLLESSEPEAVIESLDDVTAIALAGYLRNPGYGLFFDPSRNHDAWQKVLKLDPQITASVDSFLEMLGKRSSSLVLSDAVAETLDVSVEEVEVFRDQIEDRDYEVQDSHATVKTRGSAQRAFAEAVKRNYGYRCALTGIKSRDFLVASHIVPWSEDQTIRLDPSNGICLSLLVDKAFEKGYLIIEDDCVVSLNRDKIGADTSLLALLTPYEDRKLRAPKKSPPRSAYLERRRAWVSAD
ncbi:HNH endonuclease [Pseudomonas vlassakiae]|uniref:HNH endonuclease n=1 Tax=Pseudomonas vlassakiae TaxID=485888 RepID=UPI003D26DC7D